jgi:hypothetical protein
MKQRTWSIASCAAKSTLLGAGTNSSAVYQPHDHYGGGGKRGETPEPPE